MAGNSRLLSGLRNRPAARTNGCEISPAGFSAASGTLSLDDEIPVNGHWHVECLDRSTHLFLGIAVGNFSNVRANFLLGATVQRVDASFVTQIKVVRVRRGA